MATNNNPSVNFDVNAKDNATKVLKGIESAVIRTVGAVSAALTAASVVGFPVTAAATFQTQLLEVQKTTDFTADSIKGLSKDLVDLSRDINVSARDLAAIAAIGGQLGIGELGGAEAITSFTASVSTAVSALGVSADEVGTSMGKLIQIFGIAQADFDRVVNVVNRMENISTARAEELFDIMRRIGDLGGSVNVAQSAALSTIAIDLGLTAETAGTSISKIFADMKADAADFALIAGVSMEEWSRTVESDGIRALEMYLKALNEMPPAMAAATKSTLTGEGRIFGFITKLQQQVAAGGGKFRSLINTALEEYESGNSAFKEQQTILSGLQAQWDVFANRVTAVAIAAGDQLIPTLTKNIIRLGEAISSPDFVAGVTEFSSNIAVAIQGVADFVASLSDLVSSGSEAGFNWDVFFGLASLAGVKLALKGVGSVAALAFSSSAAAAGADAAATGQAAQQKIGFLTRVSNKAAEVVAEAERLRDLERASMAAEVTEARARAAQRIAVLEKLDAREKQRAATARLVAAQVAAAAQAAAITNTVTNATAGAEQRRLQEQQRIAALSVASEQQAVAARAAAEQKLVAATASVESKRLAAEKAAAAAKTALAAKVAATKASFDAQASANPANAKAIALAKAAALSELNVKKTAAAEALRVKLEALAKEQRAAEVSNSRSLAMTERNFQNRTAKLEAEVVAVEAAYLKQTAAIETWANKAMAAHNAVAGSAVANAQLAANTAAARFAAASSAGAGQGALANQMRRERVAIQAELNQTQLAVEAARARIQYSMLALGNSFAGTAGIAARSMAVMRQSVATSAVVVRESARIMSLSMASVATSSLAVSLMGSIGKAAGAAAAGFTFLGKAVGLAFRGLIRLVGAGMWASLLYMLADAIGLVDYATKKWGKSWNETMDSIADRIPLLKTVTDFLKVDTPEERNRKSEIARQAEEEKQAIDKARASVARYEDEYKNYIKTVLLSQAKGKGIELFEFDINNIEKVPQNMREAVAAINAASESAKVFNADIEKAANEKHVIEMTLVTKEVELDELDRKLAEKVNRGMSLTEVDIAPRLRIVSEMVSLRDESAQLSGIIDELTAKAQMATRLVAEGSLRASAALDVGGFKVLKTELPELMGMYVELAEARKKANEAVRQYNNNPNQTTLEKESISQAEAAVADLEKRIREAIAAITQNKSIIATFGADVAKEYLSGVDGVKRLLTVTNSVERSAGAAGIAIGSFTEGLSDPFSGGMQDLNSALGTTIGLMFQLNSTKSVYQSMAVEAEEYANAAKRIAENTRSQKNELRQLVIEIDNVIRKRAEEKRAMSIDKKYSRSEVEGIAEIDTKLKRKTDYIDELEREGRISDINANKRRAVLQFEAEEERKAVLAVRERAKAQQQANTARSGIDSGYADYKLAADQAQRFINTLNDPTLTQPQRIQAFEGLKAAQRDMDTARLKVRGFIDDLKNIEPVNGKDIVEPAELKRVAAQFETTGGAAINMSNAVTDSLKIAASRVEQDALKVKKGLDEGFVQSIGQLQTVLGEDVSSERLTAAIATVIDKNPELRKTYEQIKAITEAARKGDFTNVKPLDPAEAIKFAQGLENALSDGIDLDVNVTKESLSASAREIYDAYFSAINDAKVEADKRTGKDAPVLKTKAQLDREQIQQDLDAMEPDPSVGIDGKFDKQQMQGEVGKIKGLTADVQARIVGLPPELGTASSGTGGTPQFATGGLIRGPGTGTSDSILAALSNGEYVSDAKTTKAFGPGFFKALKEIARKGKVSEFLKNFKVPRFSEGGLIGTPAGRFALGASGVSSIGVEFNGFFGGGDQVKEVMELVWNVGGNEYRTRSSRDEARGLASALKDITRGQLR